MDYSREAVILSTTEEREQVSIYPNPTTEAFVVYNPARGSDREVTILGLDGRVLHQALLKGGESLSYQPSEIGIYLVRVVSGSGKQEKTYKVFKQ